MDLYAHWKELTSGGGWNTEESTDTQWRITEKGDTLYIDFQAARSRRDWLMAFKFWKRKFCGMRAHAGFLEKFQSIEKYLLESILETACTKYIFRGYSKGGAIATLSYIRFMDKEGAVQAICFGNPRVVNENMFTRNLMRIKLSGDIVTNLPPWLLGYRHAGEAQRIGPWRIPLPKWHADHRYEEALKSMFENRYI